MFGKTLSVANLCTALAMCAMFGLTSGAPVHRESSLYRRDLQPITPTSQIQPSMVDLLDQYRNLARQATAAPKGTAQFNTLVSQMDATKAKLEAAIQGVAVLVTDPSTASTNVTSTIAPSTTATSAATTTTAANTTTTASPGSKSSPSTTITTAPIGNTNVPAVTIVTQVGTSIVVVASQGVTSTITLATRTAVSTNPTSSRAATSASSGATSTFDINTAAAPGMTPAAPANAPAGTAASAPPP